MLLKNNNLIIIIILIILILNTQAIITYNIPSSSSTANDIYQNITENQNNISLLWLNASNQDDRIITLDVVDNKKLRNLYAATDLGVFPNRCEGGTNLVLMEYMACGKPVVATYATGHTDVLSDNHALLLKENKPFHLMHRNRLWADWVEPSLDELVAEIEYAYFHRDEIIRIGKNAGEFMKEFTWEKSAETLLNVINL